jgi:hypothetical protein
VFLSCWGHLIKNPCKTQVFSSTKLLTKSLAYQLEYGIGKNLNLKQVAKNLRFEAVECGYFGSKTFNLPVVFGLKNVPLSKKKGKWTAEFGLG